MKEINNPMLEGFLELAFVSEQEMPESKSIYAAFLYKWLELIEMCRLTGGGLVMTEDQQQARVAIALTDKDISIAKKMVYHVRQATLIAVERFMNRERILTAYPVKTSIAFDEKDQMMFCFSVASPSETADELAVTNALFLNLVGQLHLEPERLQRCPKCGKFFYQYQRKSQKYCSRSCSDMGRSGKLFQFAADSHDPSMEGRSYENECPPRNPLCDGAKEKKIKDSTN